MEYFFQTERLAVGYNNTIIVDGIEIKLEKGQILTIIGPNGSGKSTILKSITKQLKLIGGVAAINGKSIDEINMRDMARQTAVMLTGRPTPELMTCWDVAAAGRYPYTGGLGILSAFDKQMITEALRLTGAYDIKDRNFSQISDGQLQKVMLARAICQQPKLIVLDEPTSFLDIRCAVEILDVLRKMANESGLTVVMSLHELNFAKRVSDFVLCVKAGSVLYAGKPEVIFTEDIISRLFGLPPGVYTQLFGGL
ncbi:MAG: ABC transporter ATP-binding protein [Clostridiales bacterium]|jgi:iron complex transport system ATP-binding protein|nr:ABC transporter ATP-binding protein [Clostridiales bacterium]